MAKGLDIRFHHRVSQIRWGQGGAVVHCENGSALPADAVICTLPLGILKVCIP